MVQKSHKDRGLSSVFTPYTSYEYDYLNQLTRDNNSKSGKTTTYYNGNNFEWDKGRSLIRANKPDGTYMSYRYNESGIRTRKTVNGTPTFYFLDGNDIIAQETGNTTYWFDYDATGNRHSMEYNGNIYYYYYNLQGDVIGLYDSDLNVVVNYTYDSWGKVLSITGSMADTLGQANPFRYRGYYYDSESGLYYLNSRYYDPEVGRFINADGYASTGQGLLGGNMFSYCANNPICCSDTTGRCWEIVVIGLLFLGTMFLLSGCDNADSSINQKENSDKPTSHNETSTSNNDNSISKELTNDQKVLIATIAAEATVTSQGKPVSSYARQAMANVALNRVGKREWKQHKTVADICKNTGFDGYGDENYQSCMDYLNNRDGSNDVYEAIIWDVMEAYKYDITNGCQLYYTPAAMQPSGSSPNWDFSLLTEVTIRGVEPYYEGRFYKYK